MREYSYDRRTEFRHDVDLRLKQLDEQIADLERTTKRGMDKARDSAIGHVRGARKAVNQRLEQFGAATEATWEDVKGDVTAAVDSLDREVKKLLPDARPMGGTGPT